MSDYIVGDWCLLVNMGEKNQRTFQELNYFKLNFRCLDPDVTRRYFLNDYHL